MSEDNKVALGSSTIGRRHFLAGSLAGVVGAALVRLPVAMAQENGDEFPEPMILGESNVADGPTGLFHEGPGPTLLVANADSGPGVQVVSKRGPAVQALSPGGGVIGSNFTITATHAIAGVQGVGNRVGVVGTILPPSVLFTPTLSAGVWGAVQQLPGQQPITLTHQIGVAGTALGGDQIGVVAHNPSGVALSVVGGISVTCGGVGVIKKRQNGAEINDDSIHADSIVLATLTGDPGNKGASIHHVEPSEGSAVLALTAPASRDTPFSYLCFDLVSR